MKVSDTINGYLPEAWYFIPIACNRLIM